MSNKTKIFIFFRELIKHCEKLIQCPLFCLLLRHIGVLLLERSIMRGILMPFSKPTKFTHGCRIILQHLFRSAHEIVPRLIAISPGYLDDMFLGSVFDIIGEDMFSFFRRKFVFRK